jgi:hypothetical protein
MRKFRPVLAAVIAILFYTITDILIWQRIFETHQMIQFADTYHTGWFVTLAGYALIGTLLMWGSWKDCVYFLLAVFVGAFSGLEDVLYYVLDMKPMPASLPWLSGNPMIYGHSRMEVIGSVLFWMLILVAVYLVLYVWLKNLRIKPAKIKIQPEETPIVQTLAEIDKI